MINKSAYADHAESSTLALARRLLCLGGGNVSVGGGKSDRDSYLTVSETARYSKVILRDAYRVSVFSKRNRRVHHSLRIPQFRSSSRLMSFNAMFVPILRMCL